MNSCTWLNQKLEGKKGKQPSSKNKQRDHIADANYQGQNSQLVMTDSLKKTTASGEGVLVWARVGYWEQMMSDQNPVVHV